jgi:hypothetical protein
VAAAAAGAGRPPPVNDGKVAGERRRMTTGRSLRLGEAVLGGVVLALGLFVAVETTGLSAGTGAVGPRLFPYLIAAGLIVVGVLVLYEAFRGHIAHEGGLDLDWWGVALVSAGLIAQLLLLERAGWVLATALPVRGRRARLRQSAARRGRGGGSGARRPVVRGLHLRARPQPARRRPRRAAGARGGRE